MIYWYCIPLALTYADVVIRHDTSCVGHVQTSYLAIGLLKPKISLFANQLFMYVRTRGSLNLFLELGTPDKLVPLETENCSPCATSYFYKKLYQMDIKKYVLRIMIIWSPTKAKCLTLIPFNLASVARIVCRWYSWNVDFNIVNNCWTYPRCSTSNFVANMAP